MKKASCLAFLLPIIAGVFWGSVGTFVRYLNANEIGSMTILSSRVLVAALILLVGILCTKPSLLKIKLRDLWIFLIASLVGMLGLNACYNEAIHYLPMSLAAILLGLYPIFVMILAAFLFHERITGKKVLCMALALLGCTLASGLIHTGGQVQWPLRGIAIGVISAVFYAFYSVMSKIAMQRGYSVFTITFYALLIMGLALTPLTDWAALGGFVTAAPVKHIGFMLLHSLCASVLSYVLFTLGFRYMDAGKNSILAAGSEPVAALLLGMLFFREIPSALALVGTVLTIVALALLSRPEKAAAATEYKE